MPLIKTRRFILVQSTTNANVTEDNMEPYHISVFRRSTSMPPLPKLSSVHPRTTISSPSPPTPTVEVRQLNRSRSKFLKFNLQTVKRKSARLSTRLSNVLGLSAHTVDEQFNYEEQRFRSTEKFLQFFLRSTINSMEMFKELILTQVQIAEDFRDLLIDEKSQLIDRFVQSKRSMFEETFEDFSTFMQTHVIQPLTSLLRFFVSPSTLIAKRQKKLLDYDSAYSTYEKIKDPQLKQTKKMLDHSKRTYEYLNNQLLEDLPQLYQYSCELLSICLPLTIKGYIQLIHQIRIHLPMETTEELQPVTWQTIIEHFMEKNIVRCEEIFQLQITTKKGKNRQSLMINSFYIPEQTDEIRQWIRSHYEPSKRFIVIEKDDNDSTKPSIIVQNGDLVGLISTEDSYCLVDNGITQGYLSRSTLVPDDQSPPSVPIRRDLIQSTVPQARPRSIYCNEAEVQSTHSYASIEEETQIFIALYEFQSTIDGVLSLEIGEELKVIRRLDDDRNDQWWYVERVNHQNQRGYVPANYLRAQSKNSN